MNINSMKISWPFKHEISDKQEALEFVRHRCKMCRRSDCCTGAMALRCDELRKEVIERFGLNTGEKLKIVGVTKDGIEFSNGTKIISKCESHYGVVNYADFEKLDPAALEVEFDSYIKFEHVPGEGFKFGDGNNMFFIPCYCPSEAGSNRVSIYAKDRFVMALNAKRVPTVWDLRDSVDRFFIGCYCKWWRDNHRDCTGCIFDDEDHRDRWCGEFSQDTIRDDAVPLIAKEIREYANVSDDVLRKLQRQAEQIYDAARLLRG